MPDDFNSLYSDVVVYVDGACKTMTRVVLEAGVESFGGEKHDLNCSEPLLGETNQ